MAALVRDHHDMFEFQRWLQWIADEQVAAAQQAAKDSGMALGLMQDMAVGVHALGADVWWSPERFADCVTVGAPPDFYNQLGQDWGQPPFSPQYLESTGYRVYREMVHNMFATGFCTISNRNRLRTSQLFHHFLFQEQIKVQCN